MAATIKATRGRRQVVGPTRTVPDVPKRQASPAVRALAKEIGRRIDRAWELAGYESRAHMIREAGLTDRNQGHVWARGDALPRVDLLAQVAAACRVSLDWLILGAEYTPPAFVEWLETPTGHGADDEAKRFLRSLPLHGYTASTAFYDLAYQAWKLGLAKEKTPEQIAADARADAEHPPHTKGEA